MSVSVKISEENYERLSALSGELQQERGAPTSINDAIDYLYEKRNISELAGSWDMSDEEVEGWKAVLKEGWDRWNESV